MSRLKKFWFTILAASLAVWLIDISFNLDLAWYWILSPVWIPWAVIIVLGEIQLIRAYVKNQYWK